MERGVRGMKVVIQPVNPVFSEYVLQYVSEIEEPRYEYVGEEGFNTYVFECSSDDPWAAVDGIKQATRRAPLGNAMFCQVKPYGMPTWPPLFDKDKYSRS